MKGWLRIKKCVFRFLEHDAEDTQAENLVEKAIAALILLNIIAIILQSFEELDLKYSRFFDGFEVFSVIIFSVEYLLRIWTADMKYPLPAKYLSRFKFMRTPMGIIDLVAILPFYLPMILTIDLRFIRILRITRILRIFKLNRYLKTFERMKSVFLGKKDELLITFFTTFLLIIVSSTLIYYLEHDAQPDKFPNILSAFWWAIATLTTIGYGDLYPVTDMGKLLSGIIAVLGIGLVALPTGIISTGFLELISKEKESKRSVEEGKENSLCCPHCGKEIKMIHQEVKQ